MMPPPSDNVLLFGQSHRTLLYAACQTLFRHRPMRPTHALVGFEPGWLTQSRFLGSVKELPGASTDEMTRLRLLIEWGESLGGGFLLPVDSDDYRFVARHQASLPSSIRPVPMMEASLLDTVTDKLGFARMAAEMGIPVPETHSLSEFLGDPNRQKGQRFPCVVKRARGMGGTGSYVARSLEELQVRARQACRPSDWLVQTWVPGVDVALTLLADRGVVFAAVMRRRWFTQRNQHSFSPIQNVEFFHEPWLEQWGRRWVEALRFSGIADFDLRVDFGRKAAWFLECDPRLMAGMLSCGLFGVNVPGLLVDCVQQGFALEACRRPEPGCYLSAGALPEWILSAEWRKPRPASLRTGLPTLGADPVASLVRMRDALVHRIVLKRGGREKEQGSLL